jgi:RNA polymerase sigma factor (sigma-70 family)
MANGRQRGVLRPLRRVALPPGGAGLTDGELLECYLAGRDEAAFEALLLRHGPMVLGVCRRVLRNDADAHDAFQAAFLVFVRKAPSMLPRARVGNWLYGVAHKTALKAKARNRRRSAREREAGAAPRAAPAEGDWQELLAPLDEALSRLPDKYRAPVVLCALEGKPLREAAQQLGCPQGTVASRLARARGMLARRLARYGAAVAGGALAAATAQAASAAVPTALAVSTVQAATTTAGVISGNVAALTEGVLKAMLMTKLKSLTAVLLALALLGGAGLWAYRAWGAERGGAPPPAGQKDDKEAIQGAWVAVSAERNGENFSPERLKNWEKLIFTADRVTREGAQPQEGAYTIDPDKKPKEVDLFADGDSWTGIYELKGTTLKMALRCGEERPTDFDPQTTLVIVFEKKK